MRALLCILGADFQHKGRQYYEFSLSGIAIKQTKSIESQMFVSEMFCIETQLIKQYLSHLKRILLGLFQLNSIIMH